MGNLSGLCGECLHFRSLSIIKFVYVQTQNLRAASEDKTFPLFPYRFGAFVQGVEMMKLGRLRSWGTASGEPRAAAAMLPLAHDHPRSRGLSFPALILLDVLSLRGSGAVKQWGQRRDSRSAGSARQQTCEELEPRWRVRPACIEDLAFPGSREGNRQVTGPAEPGPYL